MVRSEATRRRAGARRALRAHNRLVEENQNAVLGRFRIIVVVENASHAGDFIRQGVEMILRFLEGRIVGSGSTDRYLLNGSKCAIRYFAILIKSMEGTLRP